MDKALKANLKELIKAKRGFEFEAFVHEMHLIQYGANGYQPTRERGDQGAEGLILSSRTILAAYAPDAYDEKKFIKKINDDFDEYIKTWAKDNPRWEMLYNNALAPGQLKVADALTKLAKNKKLPVKSVLIKGIDQIMHSIENEFSSTQQRKLAHYLGAPKELMVFDHIRSIIDDLISGVEMSTQNIEYKLAVNITDKIQLNYTLADRNFAEEEYIELSSDGTLKKIWGIISSYEPEQINSLKMKIKREFNALRGNFKVKLGLLTQKYMDKFTSGQDDDFEYFTRALLIYCFEQCMIGKKTIDEKESSE
ncbi:hypothetical protein [Pedobacter antarcticus]|uniref:hypothetical protein n=1 Tax=Pedobacter antarcticus TaxID=34086 RepID=UPI00087E672D|nr:hypothetical protein [Pedobacter antarcticus]SDL47229.1 hypothetical protein SAMN04488084_101405 [Pedobacter antarcticus]